MPNLIIVDWGTSNFRAVLISDSFKEIDSISTNDGILKFEQSEFYPFLLKTLDKWLLENKNVKIFMSGMIGSQNGWLETKYLLCDVSLEQLASNLLQIPNINEDIFIVPGVKTNKNEMIDLMRGEEVQIFGALRVLDKKDALLVLPGTHSKWVNVLDEKIIDFKTNMTGEVFNVINRHTILQKSIKSKDICENAFEKGLELSFKKGGMLNQIFQVRAQANVIGEDNLYSYLSGILIGHEIKNMNELFDAKSIIIVGNSTLNKLYELALNKYKLQSSYVDARMATCKAISYIYNKQKAQDE